MHLHAVNPSQFIIALLCSEHQFVVSDHQVPSAWFRTTTRQLEAQDSVDVRVSFVTAALIEREPSAS
jgi:hypothetical protein